MSSLEKKLDERRDAVGFFDESAEDYEGKFYGSDHRSFMSIRQWRVLEYVDGLKLKPASDVLDAGCGPGALVEALASRGFRVQAMDAAEGMIRQARARIAAGTYACPVEFKQGDIEKLPYADASFDLVLSTGVIEYLKDDRTVLAEFRRVLRPGGHLILPVTNVWSPANWMDVVVEPLKRQAWFNRPFNAVRRKLGKPPILPRHFDVRLHRPSHFRAELAKAGFHLEDAMFFHFMPCPRPVAKVAPSVTNAIGARMESQARGWMGPVFGEGYLTLSRRD